MYSIFKIQGITAPRYFFGASACLGLLFAILTEPENPIFFGSHFVMWQLQTLLPVAILVYVHILLHKNSGFDRVNPWLKLVVSGLLGAAIFLPLALSIDIFWGNNALPSTVPALFAQLISEAAGAVPPISISWIIINAPWVLLANQTYQIKLKKDDDLPQSKKTEELVSTADSFYKNDATVNFVTLIPDDVKGEIYYLKSELHYLLVVTNNGKALVLYNLSDAIAELPADLGIQTHRSYWVARKAAYEVISSGRQGRIKIVNNDIVPVSRTQLKATKAFFVLDKEIQD
jgi:hypothetical protein